jgi:uncharacterized membrane protein (UPF0127 family)
MTGRRLICTVVALMAIAGLSPVARAAEPDGEVRTVALRVGGHAVTAELADSRRSREQGLMGRFSLPEDRGMLFVFPRPQVMAFWMKDTPVPLSIAFISRQGRILNVEDMVPRTETLHVSKGDGVYALEMRRGWFGSHGVGPGARVSGLGRVGPARD